MNAVDVDGQLLGAGMALFHKRTGVVPTVIQDTVIRSTPTYKAGGRAVALATSFRASAILPPKISMCDLTNYKWRHRDDFRIFVRE